MIARRQPTGDKNISSKSTARDLPLFAQPLNASKFPDPYVLSGKSAAFALSRPVALGLAVITCGVLLAIALPNKAQDVPAGRKSTPAVRPSSTTRNSQIAQAQTSAPSDNSAASDAQSDGDDDNRRPVDFYMQAVRSNMFNAPVPPAPVVKPVQAVVEKEAPAPKVTPVEVNPFAEWSYTGTIKSDDQVTALLENTRTKQGEFLKAGDSFMGARVTTITDQAVMLSSGNKPHMLAKSDNITVTPLDRSAIPSTGAQGQQTAQQNGQAVIQPQIQVDMSSLMSNFGRQRGGFGGFGNNGQNFTLPNGRTFNPQQWQQRSQRMNRNFNQ